MKQHLFYCFLSLYLFANSQNAGYTAGLEKAAQRVAFTENKGQVSDQDSKPRPDILFGGNVAGMSYHLRNSGISYELKRIDSWKNLAEGSNKEKTGKAAQVPDRVTHYRIDINWVNMNPGFTIEKDAVLPGYSNFYLPVCPNGATHVQSYTGVTYKNIYNQVDLHYYEKDGAIKYDFLVAPHADYKQIKLDVSGAEAITLQRDGSVRIKTPLGDINEGKPLVYQAGRQLAATWKITGKVLSFDIKNYNPALPLVIDPLIRVWGTYYGGSIADVLYSVSTNTLNEIYVCGYTNSYDNIATTAAFQTTINTSVNGLLAKFNSSGAILWGTYYGNDYGSIGTCCATDPSGNVFMTLNIVNGSNLSTAGAFQTIAGSTNDGMLVKFNGSGVRQWATCWGTGDDDTSLSCATDASGNVYMSGSIGAPSSTLISGGHQVTTTSTTGDAYLVKFSPVGAKLWSTYYGMGATARYCATDAAGNVFLAGRTNGAGSISTPGSHQASVAGSTDTYLVKFNSSGVRQWGTFYGGTEPENASSCTTDPSGNVILVGTTTSTAGISSPGAHQTAFGSTSWNTDDMFIVKFNGSGTRQWGTYYGGEGVEGDNAFPSRCATDALGNIYLAGSTSSTFGIAVPGNHQTTRNAPLTGFLVSFDGSGTRLGATYYGGNTNADYGCACVADGLGNIYMVGSAGNNNGFTTPGAYDVTFFGYAEGFIVKFNNCTLPPSPTNVMATGNQTLCSGGTATLTATGTGTISWFSASSGGTALGTSTMFVTSATLSAGTYIWYAENATCGPSATRTPITLTINATPVITANNGSICAGQSFSIQPNGANTYTIQGGATQVSPTANSSYTIRGTSANGCLSSNTATVTITVNALPVISVPNGTLCTGLSYTINPSGASSYTIQGGSAIVTPASTTSYTVAGTSTAGCVSQSPATLTVMVSQTPTVSVNSGSICAGSSFTIVPSGANTYTVTGNTLTVTPSVTGSYSVTGTNTAGCISQVVASTVIVHALPVISVNNGSVCSGSAFTITPSGANTYTINGNTFTVSPASTTAYSIAGTSTAGCVSASTAVSNITVIALPAISVSSGSACAGGSVVIVPSGAATYTITGNTFTVTPIASTSYSVTGTSSVGCVSSTAAVAAVTIHPLPVIVVNSGSVCPGNSFTILPSGAATYTITGNTFTVNPTSNTSYSVTGTSSLGCVSPPVISAVTVYSLPVISVNSGSICSGNSFLIIPTGAATYNFSGGLSTVSPTTTTTYSVSGTSPDGCNSASPAITTITVEALPALAVTVVQPTICLGNTAVLIAGGASTYLWNNGATTAVLSVTPATATDYSVTGIGANGCINKTSSKQYVDPCTGIYVQQQVNSVQLIVYPNPNTGSFIIRMDSYVENVSFEIYTALGQLIYTAFAGNTLSEIDLQNYSAGIYFLRAFQNGSLLKEEKIIKSE